MFTRQNNELYREQFVVTYDHASLTADLEVKLLLAKRRFRVLSAQVINPTGLAVDVTNFFNIKVKQGAVIIANWSTETGEEGALVADTWAEMSMGTDVNVDAAETLSVQFDEDGTATLPVGRVVINCEYL